MVEPQVIILDCPPGMTRPSDLLLMVLDGTDIEPVEPSSKMFGSWEYCFDHIDKSVWESKKDIIEKRIRVLFDQGLIRYASW